MYMNNLSEIFDDNIILGAGLAGLSACYHTKDTVVYEASSFPGGHARSTIINGFIFDFGIHVLHTKNNSVLKILEDIGVDLLNVERNAWIYSNNTYTRYPFQANTYGLPPDIIKDCLIGFIENKHTKDHTIENYKEWILHMFGEGYASHFMLPYAEKFWGVKPEELNTDWVNVRHPRPSIEEVISGALMDQKKGFGVNSTFRYPLNGGYGKLADQFASKLKGRVKYKMKATFLDPINKKIVFNNKLEVNYNKILSTLSLPSILSIIKNVPEYILQASELLRSNSFIVVNIGINKPDLTDKSWVYFSDENISFVRASFPANLSKNCVPNGTSSISLEISHGPVKFNTESDSEIIEKAISDLIKIGILSGKEEILFAKCERIKNAYVVFDENRKPSVEIIHNYLEEIGVVPSGRFGMWAYLWSDESIINGKVAGTRTFSRKL